MLLPALSEIVQSGEPSQVAAKYTRQAKYPRYVIIPCR